MSSTAEHEPGPDTPMLQYVVTDFETTGLDPHEDAIIEAAFVGTDRNLNVLFEYETVVYSRPAVVEYIESHPIVGPMHRANGLLDALKAPDAHSLPRLDAVEAHLLDLMGRFRQPKQKPQLAGSGVGHHDHNFIKTRMPDLSRALFYSTADAGVMRRAYLNATGHLLTDIDQSKTHRAMDDVRCHLTELRAFFAMFREYEQMRHTPKDLPSPREAALLLAQHGRPTLIQMGGWSLLTEPTHIRDARHAYLVAKDTYRNDPPTLARIEQAALVLGVNS